MDTLVVEQNGKKIFTGKEDPSNPPVRVRNPFSRYCQCGQENDNLSITCEKCGREIVDSKMQCPICKRFFDYLVGEDVWNDRMVCESCRIPPKRA